MSKLWAWSVNNKRFVCVRINEWFQFKIPCTIKYFVTATVGQLNILIGFILGHQNIFSLILKEAKILHEIIFGSFVRIEERFRKTKTHILKIYKVIQILHFSTIQVEFGVTNNGKILITYIIFNRSKRVMYIHVEFASNNIIKCEYFFL